MCNKRFWIIVFGLIPCICSWAQMYSWRSHLAFGDSKHIEITPSQVYVQSGNAMYAVNRRSEQVTTYDKQNGLNGSSIATIAYSKENRCLVVLYEDGLIDFIYDNGSVISMTDLSIKDMTISKKANAATMDTSLLYVSMPFGIMVLDVAKRQVLDTYYIGVNGAETEIKNVALTEDSVYAVGDSVLYCISRTGNKMDYSRWTRTQLPEKTYYQGLAVCHNQVLALINGVLNKREKGVWKPVSDQVLFSRMMACDDEVYLAGEGTGYYQYTDKGLLRFETSYPVYDVYTGGAETWLALGGVGVMRLQNGESQLFHVDGPAVNIPYRLKIANQKLYMLQGGRWGDKYDRAPIIMIYDIRQDSWHNIPMEQIGAQTGSYIFDLMNVAVDPFNPERFYVTSYGTGLLECVGTNVVAHYNNLNSVLESAVPLSSIHTTSYVRIDGALFDAEGNLWLVNTERENTVHVANRVQLEQSSYTGYGQWYKMPIKLQNGEVITVKTPGEMFIDNRNPNWKWIPALRSGTGLILLDDNGTPQVASDDKSYYRTSFEDQDGNVVKPENIFAAVQDREGTLWVALEMGLITIPASVDFKTSNACERIKIARNDGTNLADYLLNTERINAIAVDGANRKWFGTAGSGLYLISADGQETIEHFTTDNSPLLSDEIVSLAIDPISGKVFIGTSKGLMSYQSDAASPFEDYSSAYAYPNPVRPDYNGVITITGLMDETAVHIVDNAGNLVCQTRSYGGTAVWDGKTADGRRVASGVYSVLCNEATDNKHAVVKILVMH